MAGNEDEGNQGAVVVTSPEQDQPEMSRDMKLEAAIRMVKAGGVRGTVARHYGLSATTLSRHLSGNLKKKGGQPVFTPQQERVFVDHLLKLSDWLVPISRKSFQSYIHFYLKSVGKNVPRFKDNKPGKDWAYSFFKRNKQVTERRSTVITPAKALVTVDSLRQFFDLLKPQLTGDDAIDPSCILNYDETNLTNDPGSEVVIVRRSQKNNRKIKKKSKAGFSVMFAGSADGVMLPPYVVYKSTNKTGTVNPKWMEGCQPPHAYYDTAEKGWFKMKQFDRWFQVIVLPWANKSPDKRKLVIGDNLSAHFSPKVFELCRQNNISFKCLPPNTTHFLQPLDVAVFSPLKKKWRSILDQWKESNPRASYNKQEFSHRLGQLMEDANQKNVKSGFEATGICPFNVEKAIKCMPLNEQPELDATGAVLVDYLKERTDAIRPKPTKRTLSRPPPGTDLQDLPPCSSSSSSSPKPKKKKTLSTPPPGTKKKKTLSTPPPGTDMQQDLPSPPPGTDMQQDLPSCSSSSPPSSSLQPSEPKKPKKNPVVTLQLYKDIEASYAKTLSSTNKRPIRTIKPVKRLVTE